MTDPIVEHLADLTRSRYSHATLDARERLLHTLPRPLLTNDRQTIQTWWATRQQRADGEPRAASSLSQEASHVRAFYRWAMMQGLTDRNAADWLPRVRQKTPAVAPVSEGDLYRLMQDSPTDLRRAIALAAMAGFRSSEVAAARWEHLDPGNGVIWVPEGKGSKGRTVPLSGGLLAALGDPGEGPIIGREATAKAVSQSIARYMRSRGVNLTAHKLRARAATRFLTTTGDLAAAAAMLGHSDLSSIGRYVVASSDTMRRGSEAMGRVG